MTNQYFSEETQASNFKTYVLTQGRSHRLTFLLLCSSMTLSSMPFYFQASLVEGVRQEQHVIIGPDSAY